MPRVRIRKPRRPATPAERVRIGLLIGGAVLAAAVIVVVDLGADNSVIPEVASWIDPGSSDAQTAMAETIASDDLDSAHAYANRAITHNPIDDRALVIAALAATSTNQIGKADALFAHITALTRRQALAETWMFDVAAQRGDYVKAIGHADAALRRRTGADEQVMPVLAAITDSSAALPALARKLATNPPWRQAFFRTFARSKQGDAVALFDALHAVGDRPGALEVAAMASQEIAAGSVAKAHAVWARGFGQAMPPLLSPNFESTTQYGDFGWSIMVKGGAHVVEREGGGHALEVEPSNTGKRPVRVVQQAMLLASGRHAISFEGRSVEAGGTVAAVVARCAGDDTELGRAPVPAGASWTTMRFVFGVPATDCPIQKLVIEAVPNLTQASSPALIDNFKVE